MNNINDLEHKFQPCLYSDTLLNLIVKLNKTSIIQADIEKIKKACHAARIYHGDQLRKSGEPYYSHPLIVAYLFAKYVAINAPQYYTTDLIIIAILHDTIEDTTLTKDMIAGMFNQFIARGVEDLTRLKHEIKTTAADTVNSLFTQYKLDILHIKIFDRLHNIRTIYAMIPKKQKKIIDETVSHFIPMAAYLELYEIKQEFIKLCINGIKQFQSFVEYKLHFPSVFLNLQNEIKQIHKL